MTWIQTYTGRAFDLLNPDPAKVDIEDIAHSLGHLCRFTGHTRDHYSVAQHCVLASYQVPPEYALPTLLHDGEEAYTNDPSSPFKEAIREILAGYLKGLQYEGRDIAPGEIDPYREISDRISAAIGAAFNVPFDLFHHPIVKEADLRMLLTERREQFAPLEDEPPSVKGGWPYALKPYPFRIYPWSARQARAEYWNRFVDLTGRIPDRKPFTR